MSSPSNPDFFEKDDENPYLSLKAARPETFKDHLDFYSIFRDYTKHEDSLINNRLSWVLTIHGFMYASYGLTLQKQLDVAAAIYLRKDPTPPQHETIIQHKELANIPMCYVYLQTEAFLFGICFVGMAISVAGFSAIRAAQSTMRNVTRIYRMQSLARVFEKSKTYRNNQSPEIPTFKFEGTIKYKIPGGFFLPGLTGGGKRQNKVWGTNSASAMPIILFSSWVAGIIATAVLSGTPIEAICGSTPSAWIGSKIASVDMVTMVDELGLGLLTVGLLALPLLITGLAYRPK